MGLNPFFVRASVRTQTTLRMLTFVRCLNPFFVRASVRTSKESNSERNAASQSLLRQGKRSDTFYISSEINEAIVSIPSSSGQAFGRPALVVRRPSGLVSIPSSSGQAFGPEYQGELLIILTSQSLLRQGKRSDEVVLNLLRLPGVSIPSSSGQAFGRKR